MIDFKSNKKYFSIAEVSKYLGLSAVQLRYIERSDKDFSITKIRNRRYYTRQNIDYIQNKYNKSNENHQILSHRAILLRVNKLLKNFTRLYNNLNSI